MVSAFDQEAYGNVKVGSQSGYHLTTKEYDSISELYYFWQRWYDPETAQFILKDPIKYMNRYWYCSNNPLLMVDVNGMYTVWEDMWDDAISRCSNNKCDGPQNNCCSYVRCVINESTLAPMIGGGQPITAPSPVDTWSSPGILCHGNLSACQNCINGSGGFSGHIAVVRSDGRICQCTSIEGPNRVVRAITCERPFGGDHPPDFFFPLN
jgi:RHS repeat-associated protein